MADCYDFVQLLETDVALKILMCLGDSADLIRASCVSLLWRDCVLANGLCKQLCLTKFPQLTNAAHIIEVSAENENFVNVGSSSSMQWQALEREHRVYASLFKALTTTIMINCLHDAIGASSTDNDPKENIRNTLDPWDLILQRPSYWSSKGHSCPEVPETLTYILKAKFCVVTSISIQPFQAYFQTGHPIYSSKSVRFRMGHLKFPSDTDKDLRELPQQQRVDDKLVWTYTSQEFLMSQENSLQQFKLPEPVLCIGGFLQIELLGRVQTQATDNLYYICVANVQVLGKPLTPAFDVDILEPAGKFSFKYNREALPCTLSNYLPPTPSGVGSPPGHRIWAHLEDFIQYIMLRNEPADVVLDWEDAAIDGDEFYHMMQDG